MALSRKAPASAHPRPTRSNSRPKRSASPIAAVPITNSWRGIALEPGSNDGRVQLSLGPAVDHPRPRHRAGVAGLPVAVPCQGPGPAAPAGVDLERAGPALRRASLVGELRAARSQRLDVPVLCRDPAADDHALHALRA